MSVSATINVSASALDSATSSGVEAEKKAALSSATKIDSAGVVVVTGTCGTTAVQVDPSNAGYRGADGELVSWDSYSGMRLAFQATPSAQVDWDDVANLRLTSRNNEVAMTSLPLGTLPLSPGPFEVKTVAGLFQDPYTATFTVMFIREV